jgi:hypothetical protein
VFIIQGCSTFKSETQPVSFKCDPPDINLVVSGKRYSCPVTINLVRNQEFTIEGYKDGYIPYKKVVSYHNNDTFALDVIGAILFAIPAIGLVAPGAKDLDETDIFVTLSK